jgi:hypothetical protein
VGHFSLLTIRRELAGCVFRRRDGAFLKNPLVFRCFFTGGRDFCYASRLASQRNQKDNTAPVPGFSSG